MVGNNKHKLSREEVKEALTSLIEEFQKKALKKLQNKINAKAKKIIPHENGDSVQESIDYLRVCIKYTLFDLDATRRELRMAIRKLDEK